MIHIVQKTKVIAIKLLFKITGN